MNEPRQQQQLERRVAWEKEGHLEWPTQLSTYLKPEQGDRLEWIRRNVEGSILEVGCSWGYVTALIRGKAGVDLNPENIEIARKLNRSLQFHVADARNLPFYNGQFDTVILPDVLEHLAWTDVGLAVREARRVARHLVLATVPNGDMDTEEAKTPKHAWLPTMHRLVQHFVGTDITACGIWYFIREDQ